MNQNINPIMSHSIITLTSVDSFNPFSILPNILFKFIAKQFEYAVPHYGH